MHTPTAEDVEGAIRLQLASQVSFWDAMVLQSVLRELGALDLWSGRPFQQLTVRNPFTGH